MAEKTAGWAVATKDSAGLLHLDWDGELHTRRDEAEAAFAECVDAHWDTALLRVEVVKEQSGKAFE